MPQVVYGDVYFLINFSIDFLVLTLCGRFLRLRRRLVRLVLAAAAGGAYAVYILLPSLAWWQEMVLQFIFAAFLCFVAYGRMPFGSFFRLLISFYGAALLLGGAVNALYALLGGIFGTAGVGETNAVISEKKAEIFMLYALISGCVFLIAGRILSKRSRTRSMMVEVEENGRRAVFEGLVDSGNLLTDPLSGKAVIVARSEQVRTILPPGAESILRPESGRTDSIPLEKRRKLRVIVARGIDGGRTLLGYLPDCILLYSKDQDKNKRAVDAILAIYDGDTQDFGGYGGIVPAALVG